MGADSNFFDQLEQRTRPLVLLTIAHVVVLGLLACYTIISMICNGHWLPPYALHLLCGKWNARVVQTPIFGCGIPMRVVDILVLIHQVLTHHSHTSIHPSPHNSPHSRSLGGKDGSLSCLAPSALTGTPTNPGGREERTPLSNQVKRRT